MESGSSKKQRKNSRVKGTTTSALSGPSPEDPIKGLIRIFITNAQVWLIKNSDAPAPRAAFRRFHGAAHGTFDVCEGLDPTLRVGVLSGNSYPIWVRFSSDTSSGQDLGSLAGIGIKLFDVRSHGGVKTQDFLLQNNERFFVRNLREMYDDSVDETTFLKTHPVTKEILDEMNHRIGSLLCVPYWSCLPSRFGPDRYVKYKLEPHDSDVPVPAKAAAEYLKTDFAWRLSKRETRFNFCLQVQTKPAEMPLDDATIAWSEADSPPIHVATITLPAQDVNARGQSEYANNLAFSPWHSLPEHEPYGDLQDARGVIYDKSCTVRRWVNGVPNEEPQKVRPLEPPY